MEWKKKPDTLNPVRRREGHHDGQRATPQDIWEELLRLGREGSEGMYSLPQLMATEQTEPSSCQGLTAREQEEMGTS